jgi:hypothetical protein
MGIPDSGLGTRLGAEGVSLQGLGRIIKALGPDARLHAVGGGCGTGFWAVRPRRASFRGLSCAAEQGS